MSLRPEYKSIVSQALQHPTLISAAWVLCKWTEYSGTSLSSHLNQPATSLFRPLPVGPEILPYDFYGVLPA